jgi:hypothetical protein
VREEELTALTGYVTVAPRARIMAQCKLTPREFIGNAFSPQIAVVCSAAADAACQKNNLSFVELLQPFCKLNTEGKAGGRQTAPATSPVHRGCLRIIMETAYGVYQKSNSTRQLQCFIKPGMLMLLNDV